MHQSGHKFFENTTVGFARVGLNGYWVQVNRNLCRMLGYSETELARLTVQKITHPEDFQIYFGKFLPVLSGETDIAVMELRLLRRDESPLWVHVTATLNRDAADNPLYLSLVVDDIQQRKQTEAALKDSEERLHLMMRATHEGLWEWMPASDTIIWSDGVYEILGMEPEEIVPSMDIFMERVHPEDREFIWESIQAAFHGNQLFDLEFRMRDASGNYRYVHSRGETVRDAHGTPIRMAGVVSDVTHLVEAEQQLKWCLEREQLVFETCKLLNQSANFAEILETAANQVGGFFEADRCLVLYYERKDQAYDLKLSGQYCAPNVPLMPESDIPLRVQESIRCSDPEAHDKLQLESRSLEKLFPEVAQFLKNSRIEPEPYLDAIRQLWHQCGPCSEALYATLSQYLKHHQIRSSLNIEMRYRDKAYGLIINHQCNADRKWTEAEMGFLKKLGAHVAFVIHQAELSEKVQAGYPG